MWKYRAQHCLVFKGKGQRPVSRFSTGLGSRLLKSAGKDSKSTGLGIGGLAKPPAPGDAPKRTSIFSKPASSIPIANGANPLNKGPSDPTPSQTISRPRFSMSAATQVNHTGIRKSLGDT